MEKETPPSSPSQTLLRCRILTPERTVCDLQSDFVVVWLEDGQLGIAPRRKPLVASLAIGPLRIGRIGHSPKYYYVEGGFVEVADNVVTVLTERAIPAEELDPAAVSERLQSALALPATSEALRQRRQQAVRIAQAQWRVSEYLAR